MNQFVQDALWKMLYAFAAAFAAVVWSWLMVIFGRWCAFRGLRAIKITGKWIDGKLVDKTWIKTDPKKSWGFNFTLFLLMEPSDFDAGQRKVIGVFYWQLTHWPENEPRPRFSSCYETVEGIMILLNIDNDKASFKLSSTGVSNDLIIKGNYDLKLSKVCCRRARCDGTSTNPQPPHKLYGGVEGIVVADTR